MDVQAKTETLDCPACQGDKTMRWGGKEYSCLLCKGKGQIKVKENLTPEKAE